jgi:hypothetical protein
LSTSTSTTAEAGPSQSAARTSKGKSKGKTKGKLHKAQQDSAGSKDPTETGAGTPKVQQDIAQQDAASSKEPNETGAGKGVQTGSAGTTGAAQELAEQTEADRELRAKKHDGRGLISAALDVWALALNIFSQYGKGSYLGGCHTFGPSVLVIHMGPHFIGRAFD